MFRWSPRLAAPLAFVIFIAGATSAAVQDDQIARLKLMQQQILMSEPAEKLEKMERLQAWRKKAKRASSGKSAKAGLRRKPFTRPTDLEAGPQPARASQTRRMTLSSTSAPPNRKMNDKTGEPWGSCQSEVSIAADGNNLVATWNDGIGVYGPPTFPEDTQGFGYSINGGLDWTDGGPLPNDGNFIWSSDPVVVVNEKTGAFYYCGLIDNPGAGTNGVAIVKGAFSGATFAWGAPVVVRTFPNSSNLIDKQWMAVDSLTGNLYMSFSNFAIVGGSAISNAIQFTRSIDDGQNWTSPTTISAGTDAGRVQGSRPAVGPSGEIYVVWHAIGQSSGPNKNSPFGRDFLRVRKSIDGGTSFGGQVTADSVFSNFSSGAPGFNRGLGITFPGIGVDRSTAATRGRVYLTWNESLNFYNDPLPVVGQDPARREIENNNGSANATPFVPGEILRGVVSVPGDPGDLDYWKWSATQGQTTIFYLDSLAADLDASFRIFCSDGTTLLGFSQNGSGGAALLVFTAPTTATYFARVASYQGASVGGYRILTTTNFTQNDRARDHRDIFVKSSADGVTWGPTVRVNDSPGHFDDWLPEVTVDARGRVFVANYDWRDATTNCGGGSNIYLYRSDDGGANWISGQPMTDVTTNWTDTYSTLLPNQGDYMGLSARDSIVYIAWADGRDPDPSDGDPNKDPDVYMTSTTLNCQSAPVSVVGSGVFGDTIVVTWSAPQSFLATLSRQVGSGAFVDIGPVTADANDQIVYVDPGVALGATYTYHLVVQGFCQTFVGTISVPVQGPGPLPFGIELIRPNPSRHDVFVRTRTTGSDPAFLELIDITGRSLKKVSVTCPPLLFCETNVTDGLRVKPGLYFVRLSEGSRESVKRVSIFP